MKKLLITSIFAASLFLCFSCGNKAPKTDVTTKTEKVAVDGYYTCPMHPEIHKSKPGNCPKCGMVLELKNTAEKDSMQMKTATDSMPMKK